MLRGIVGAGAQGSERENPEPPSREDNLPDGLSSRGRGVWRGAGFSTAHGRDSARSGFSTAR